VFVKPTIAIFETLRDWLGFQAYATDEIIITPFHYGVEVDL